MYFLRWVVSFLYFMVATALLLGAFVSASDNNATISFLMTERISNIFLIYCSLFIIALLFTLVFLMFVGRGILCLGGYISRGKFLVLIVVYCLIGTEPEFYAISKDVSLSVVQSLMIGMLFCLWGVWISDDVCLVIRMIHRHLYFQPIYSYLSGLCDKIPQFKDSKNCCGKNGQNE